MSSFNTKKAECEKRGIAFNFTKDQWNELQAMKSGGKCAYTGQGFQTKGKLLATVERIDENKPYEPTNCVLVTSHANGVKCRYIEQKQSQASITPEDKHTLKTIKNALSDEKSMEKKLQTYLNAYSGDVTATDSGLCDLDVTELYVEYARKAMRTGKGFDITINDFKRTLSRKRCEVSKILLPNMKQRVIRVIDEDKPVSKDNIQVTSQQVSDIIDSILALNMTTAQKKAMIANMGEAK
ncbi:HNH endonuclease [Vibrio phage D480]